MFNRFIKYQDIVEYLGDDIVYEEYKKSGKKTGDIDYEKVVKVPDKIKGCPVTVIGENAFSNGKFEKIIIPETVIRIEQMAFADCSSMEIIDVTENVEYIGALSFSGCEKLAEINIFSCIELGEGAFSCCSSITDMSFYEEIEVMPLMVCIGMDGLESIEIPENVKKMAEVKHSRNLVEKLV